MSQNMKNIKLISILLPILFFIIAFSSCNYIEKPGEHHITRLWNVHDFTSIQLDMMGNVEYIQSKEKPTVLIYGADNYVNKINLFVKNDTLYIKTKTKRFMNNIKDLHIIIKSSILNNLLSDGIGQINITKKLQTNTLKVVNSGIGKIKIDSLMCNNIIISSDGIGSVRVSGKGRYGNYLCDGIGNIEAYDLEVNNAKANCDGIGKIACYATDSLVATISGIGKIKYKGKPMHTKFSKDGIGSISEY